RSQRTASARGEAGFRADVVDAVLAERVLHRLTQCSDDLIAGAEIAADRELVEAGEVLIVALDGEDVEASGNVTVEEIRIGEADVALLRAERRQRVDAQIETFAEQIAFVDPGVDQRTVGRRETDAEGEIAGRLFF